MIVGEIRVVVTIALLLVKGQVSDHLLPSRGLDDLLICKNDTGHAHGTQTAHEPYTGDHMLPDNIFLYIH